jgi:hypothetical protein
MTALIVLGLYLLVGAAVWAWVAWRRRRRRRGKTARRPQEFPLLTGFLLLLTWPMTLWEELRAGR